MKPFFNRSWVSTAILAQPSIIEGRIQKGILILNYVDEVLPDFPEIPKYFFVVERRGWNGINRSHRADIKLIEDLSTIDEARNLFPNSILLDIGPADFVDQDVFRPVGQSSDIDVIQISCWSPRKRIELLIAAAALLPKRKFIHLGHFEHRGSTEEQAYRCSCLELAGRIAPNVYFPFGSATSNHQLPGGKQDINNWINRAKMGILTTRAEGINRFKMECIAADRPVLVPIDAGPTTQKHINEKTGGLFQPTPRELAEALENSLNNLGRFSPRDYLIQQSGLKKSVNKLQHAVAELCRREGFAPYPHDITWDGRNQSLHWGEKAFQLLDSTLSYLNKTHSKLNCPATGPSLEQS